MASRKTELKKRKSRRTSSRKVPPKTPKQKKLTAGEWFERLVALQARLRAPNGCPWDREQTHATLRTYLIEEAYEVLDAMKSGDDAKFANEMGDLLLQVVFHSQIATEEGRFTFFQLSLSGGHLYPQISAATNVSLYSPGTYFDKRTNLAEAVSFHEEPVHAPIDSLRCIHHTARRREHHPFRRSCRASPAATPAARQ